MMSNNAEWIIKELHELQRRFSVHRFFNFITDKKNPHKEKLDYKNPELTEKCIGYCFPDGKPLNGCKKYQSCKVITKNTSDDYKKKFNCWDVMSEECNNPNWHKNKTDIGNKWFKKDERNRNPYGIYPEDDQRGCYHEDGCNNTEKIGLCRDALPCPFFGCITKKIIENHIKQKKLETADLTKLALQLEKADLCPYKYYFPADSVDAGEEQGKENPLRFLQCYVSSADHIEFLEKELRLLGVGFSFYDWSGTGRHTHLQKSSEDVVDLPWRYYDLNSHMWTEPELDLFIQSLFQNIREKLKPEDYPELYKETREELDGKLRIESVTDGEISFFIFAWRFLNICQSIYEEGKTNADLFMETIKSGFNNLNQISKETQLELDAINKFYKKHLFVDKFKSNPRLAKILYFQEEKISDGNCNLKTILIKNNSFWDELEIEGLIGKKNDDKIYVTVRFLNLAEYFLKSVFINQKLDKSERNNLYIYLNDIRKRTDSPLCKYVFFLETLREGKKWENYSVNTKDFIMDIASLLAGVAIIYGKSGEDKKIGLRADVRFPLLPYLIWRAQSPIPFCHIWFPISNQSLMSKKGKLIPRYTIEGSECVSVFAEIGIDKNGPYPLESPYELNDNESELIKMLRYHQMYMQMLTLPMIDTIMYGKHIIPSIEGSRRDVANLNNLLTDFQHTLLQKVLDTLIWAAKNKNDRMSFKFLCDHLKKRGIYLDALSKYFKDSSKAKNVPISVQDLKDFILKGGIFANSIISADKNSTFHEALKNWKKLFKIKANKKWKAELPEGSLETILENLLHNSLVKHYEKCSINKIYIALGFTKGGKPFLVYYDNGIGFSQDVVHNLCRWIQFGPSEKEDKKGYGYWLIGRILDHLGGKMEFIKINKDFNPTAQKCSNKKQTVNPKFQDVMQCFNGDFKKSLELNKLHNGNYRILHYFEFKKGRRMKNGEKDEYSFLR